MTSLLSWVKSFVGRMREEALIERLEGLGRQLQIACFYAGVGRAAELDRSVIRRREEPGNADPPDA